MKQGDQLPGTRGIDLARAALARASDARKTISGAVPERDFQRDVVRLAELLGWATYHTYDSRRSAPGFPDLVLVKGPRCIFAELKSQNGRVTAEQLAWIGRLDAVDEVEACIWRPADMDEIEQTLRRSA